MSINNQKQEILEYVKNHAEIVVWGSKKTEEKIVFINLLYPIHGERQFFTKSFNVGFIPEQEIKISPTWFEAITEEIMKKLEETKKEKAQFEWERKKIIYKVCPEMLCGQNPCSCKEEVNHA